MGQHDYRLKSLADDELLAGLSNIVGRRNQITAEFLAYLAELDDRQLFLELGFSSLFEYCVEALGLCESTAGRHIAAARVYRYHPQVFAMVACGALHASASSLMKKHLTPDNARELFELCQRRSSRKVEELLAARFPKPDVRDLVRRLPTPVGSTASASAMNASSSIPATSTFEPTLTTANPTTEPKSQPIPTWRRKHHCPAEVVREVFVRDGKRCTYASPDGRRCSARRCLELDHIDPRAEGGPDTVCNLRLRCQAHPPSGITKRVNQWYARQYFGRARVAAAVKRSRLARSAQRSDRAT